MVILAVSGAALIQVLVWVVVVGLVFWLVWWLISMVGLPEPFNKIVRALVALVAVLILVSKLLDLIGVHVVYW